MSRNLCRTDCHFCEGRVVLVEPPRKIHSDDCGLYFNEYVGMLVAHAECEDCEAKYIAWVSKPHMWPPTCSPLTAPFHDLSFRDTFNDEPGEDDLPKYKIEVKRVRVGLWES